MPPNRSALDERLFDYLPGMTLEIQFIRRVVQILFKQAGDYLAALLHHLLLLKTLLVCHDPGVGHHHHLPIRPDDRLAVRSHLWHGRLRLDAENPRADNGVVLGGYGPGRIPVVDDRRKKTDGLPHTVDRHPEGRGI